MDIYSNIKDKVKKIVNEKVIIAVSGGVDSVVILDVISKIVPAKNILVCHFNHGLRPESENEEKFVKSLAKLYKAEFTVGRSKSLKERRGNLEENARNARYNFLLKKAFSRKIKYIFVAHHADDQLETMMLNFERGANFSGLSGMSRESKVDYSGKEITIFRPMLNIFKKDIQHYQKSNNLTFCEDTSNLNIKFRRNYFRHKILNNVKEKNKQQLLVLAKEIEKEDKKLKKSIIKIRSKAILKQGKNVLLLDRNYLRSLSKNLCSLVMVHLISLLKENKRDIFSKNIKILREAVENSKPGKQIILPSSLRAIIDYDTLLLLKGNAHYNNIKSMKLELGNNLIKPLGINIFLGLSKKKLKKDFIFDLDKLSLPLSVSFAKKGQRICINKVGSKKLQDLFVDKKIEQRFRQMLPVVSSNKSEVITVLDIQKSGICNPDKKTVQYLFVDIKNI